MGRQPQHASIDERPVSDLQFLPCVAWGALGEVTDAESKLLAAITFAGSLSAYEPPRR